MRWPPRGAHSTGKTKTSLIAAIVKEHPRPIAELQPLTPPALQHVVDKCLAKDPDDRWQSVHDVASELQWIAVAGSQAGVAAPVAASRTRSRRSLIAVAAVGWAIAVAAAIVAAIAGSRNREARRLTYAEIAQPLAGVYVTVPLAVSPDGRQVATITRAGNTNQLWVRDLASREARVLPGTDDASYPFWSPDGHAIGFFAGGKLKTIDVQNGALQTIADAPGGRGGAWSSSGVIVFAPQPIGPLMKVSENGGTPAPATTTQTPTSETHRNPLFLPDGKHFLYIFGPQARSTGDSVRVASIDGGLDRKILDYASTAALVDGWLITLRQGNLLAQRFDASSLSVTGKPTTIAQRVEWYGPKFNAAFAAGANTLVYQPARHPRQQFYYYDSEASAPVATGDPGWYAQPRIAADGKRFVANRWDNVEDGSDLWIYDIGGTAAARVTHVKNSGMDMMFGTFSPDGRRLGVSVDANNGTSQSWIQPVGGGANEPVATQGQYAHISDWSADGKTLLITVQGPSFSTTIDGTRRIVPLPRIDSANGNVFSPDGKWIAHDTEGGLNEVFVTNYPAATASWQVSRNGGHSPFWSPDGGTLYFLSGDRIMAAAVHAGDSFTADAPRVITTLGDHIADFALSSSGRFLVLRELDAGTSPATVVLNWERLLEK